MHAVLMVTGKQAICLSTHHGLRHLQTWTFYETFSSEPQGCRSSESNRGCRLPATPLHIYGPPRTAGLVQSSLFPDPLQTSSTDALPRLCIYEWTLEQYGSTRTIKHNGFEIVASTVASDQANLDRKPVGGVAREIAQVRLPAPKKAAKIPVLAGLSWSVPAAAGFVVSSAQLVHRIACWGYVFQVQRL